MTSLNLDFPECFTNRLRRPVGRMTAEEQHHEGEFRFVNSRLITNRCTINCNCLSDKLKCKKVVGLTKTPKQAKLITIIENRIQANLSVTTIAADHLGIVWTKDMGPDI